MFWLIDDSSVQMTPNTKFLYPDRAVRDVDTVAFTTLDFDGSKVIRVSVEDDVEIMP